LFVAVRIAELNQEAALFTAARTSRDDAPTIGREFGLTSPLD
jgi:hypothetical protein